MFLLPLVYLPIHDCFPAYWVFSYPSVFLSCWAIKGEIPLIKITAAWKLLQAIRVLKVRIFPWRDWLRSSRLIFLKTIFHILIYILGIIFKLAWLHARSIVEGYLLQTICRCRKTSILNIVFFFRRWELLDVPSTFGLPPHTWLLPCLLSLQLSFRIFIMLSLLL